MREFNTLKYYLKTYKILLLLIILFGSCKKKDEPVTDNLKFEWNYEKPAGFTFDNTYYHSTSVNASMGWIDTSAYYSCAMNFIKTTGFNSVLYVHIPISAQKNDIIDLDYPMSLLYNIGNGNVSDYGKSDLTGKCKILNVTNDTIEIAFYGAIIMNSNKANIKISEGYFISKID